MELIGELKKKVDAARNRQEAKEFIEQAGMHLTDEELEQVSGGGSVYKRPHTNDPLINPII